MNDSFFSWAINQSIKHSFYFQSVVHKNKKKVNNVWYLFHSSGVTLTNSAKFVFAVLEEDSLTQQSSPNQKKFPVRRQYMLSQVCENGLRTYWWGAQIRTNFFLKYGNKSCPFFHFICWWKVKSFSTFKLKKIINCLWLAVYRLLRRIYGKSRLRTKAIPRNRGFRSASQCTTTGLPLFCASVSAKLCLPLGPRPQLQGQRRWKGRKQTRMKILTFPWKNGTEVSKIECKLKFFLFLKQYRLKILIFLFFIYAYMCMISQPNSSIM